MLGNTRLIVRKTFWDLGSDSEQEMLLCRPRSRSVPCIDDADFLKPDFSDSTTIAGTSHAGSVVGSDDRESLGVLEVVSGPPGVFAAPGQWIASSITSCQIPNTAGGWTYSTDSQPGAGTAVVVRNLAGDVSRASFLETLDTEGFTQLYNFVYLPVGFQKGARLGYAIVSFIEPAIANAAVLHLSSVELGGKRLDVSLTKSKQCLSDLILRYRDSPVMHWSVPEECKPVIFSNGHVVPFPQPTVVLEPLSDMKPKKNKKNKKNAAQSK